MKKEFQTRPDGISDQWCINAGGFAWQDFLTAMPSLVFVVTGWKSNGKQNACLHSWSTFMGAGTDDFICFMPAYKGGHMYQSLKQTGECVLNFPSIDVYDRCIKTIGNNQFEADEITAAGLTAENAMQVNAPRIQECFLQIECEYMWERALFDNAGFFGNHDVAIALKAVHIAMERECYVTAGRGR